MSEDMTSPSQIRIPTHIILRARLEPGRVYRLIDVMNAIEASDPRTAPAFHGRQRNVKIPA
jgi:hypothetical protein